MRLRVPCIMLAVAEFFGTLVTHKLEDNSGSKGGDNGSNIQFLGVSDFGFWFKGNVQEFSSF